MYQLITNLPKLRKSVHLYFLYFSLYLAVNTGAHWGHQCLTAVRKPTCLLSDTRCVSSWRTDRTPASWEVDRAVMSVWSRCMPLGGLRRALSGWCLYWAPMLSFFTGPDRLGGAFSALLLFCFTAWEQRGGSTMLSFFTASGRKWVIQSWDLWRSPLFLRRPRSRFLHPALLLQPHRCCMKKKKKERQT